MVAIKFGTAIVTIGDWELGSCHIGSNEIVFERDNGKFLVIRNGISDEVRKRAEEFFAEGKVRAAQSTNVRRGPQPSNFARTQPKPLVKSPTVREDSPPGSLERALGLIPVAAEETAKFRMELEASLMKASLGELKFNSEAVNSNSPATNSFEFPPVTPSEGLGALSVAGYTETQEPPLIEEKAVGIDIEWRTIPKSYSRGRKPYIITGTAPMSKDLTVFAFQVDKGKDRKKSVVLNGINIPKGVIIDEKLKGLLGRYENWIKTPHWKPDEKFTS